MALQGVNSGAKFQTALIYAFTLIAGLANTGYFRKHTQPAGLVLVLYVSLVLLLYYWLRKDSKIQSQQWPWDSGFYLFLAWPLLLPYYLFKTRRTGRAILIMIAFLGAYVAGVALAVLIVKQ